MAIRMFLAIDLDEIIRQRLIKLQDQIDMSGAKVRWVDPEQLHLTLKFLGDVPDEMVNDVCALSQQVAAEISPFEFQVRDVLCVPPGGPVRMFWAGVKDADGSLKSLYSINSMLDEAMADLPIRQEEREFKPHITLARVKFAPGPGSLRKAVQKVADTDFGIQHADELVVYSSQLTPDGPVYSALHRPAFGK